MVENDYLLTVEDIVKLAKENVKLVKKRKPDPEGAKGWFCPAERTVLIYLPAIESRADEAKTLYEEFCHAKINILNNDSESGDCERIGQKLEAVDEDNLAVLTIKELYYKRQPK